MLSLAERVYRSIQRHRLLPPDVRLVVATSGGADSTALILLLRELAPRFGFTIASLAHFNHRLRGSESDADEAACAALANRLGLPFDRADGDVRDAARRWHTSVEDAGRRLRYDFLQAVAERREAGRVAVGHTRDDQAETVLLHLIRGTGARGRAGMAPRRGSIVRPLIECRHDELVAWLQQRGESFREDRSNQDARYLRNRVRLELVPFLRERFSPSVVEVLARGADLAAAEADLIDAMTQALFDRAVRLEPGRVLLDPTLLATAPRVLATRVCRDALKVQAGGRQVSLDHAELLFELATAPSASAGADLPGQRARKTGGHLALVPQSVPRRSGKGPMSDQGRIEENAAVGIQDANSFVQKLSIPGEVLVRGTRLTVSAELSERQPGSGFSPDDLPGEASRVAVDGSSLVDLRTGAVADLLVRTRRPGDRFRPLGLSGRKKVQDYFVDRKVPREFRDRVPLVTTTDDRIVWVAGHGMAEDFRVRDDTAAVVILSLRGEIA